MPSDTLFPPNAKTLHVTAYDLTFTRLRSMSRCSTRSAIVSPQRSPV